jgi:hypothetical protein
MDLSVVLQAKKLGFTIARCESVQLHPGFGSCFSLERRYFFKTCHSERSEESLVISGLLTRCLIRNSKRCFAPLNITGLRRSAVPD